MLGTTSIYLYSNCKLPHFERLEYIVHPSKDSGRFYLSGYYA